MAALVAGVAIAALSGCQSVPVSKPEVPAPPLRLLEAQPLVLADECVAEGSFFVEFTVLSDGRTARIQPPSGPPCVQQALIAWVGSFHYAPPPVDTPAAIEWMAVTARKGS